MKLSFPQEFEIKDEDINITLILDLNKETAKFCIKFICPNCSGYGCNRHNSDNNKNCFNGSVSKDIHPDKIYQVLDKDNLSKLRSIISNLKI